MFSVPYQEVEDEEPWIGSRAARWRYRIRSSVVFPLCVFLLHVLLVLLYFSDSIWVSTTWKRPLSNQRKFVMWVYTSRPRLRGIPRVWGDLFSLFETVPTIARTGWLEARTPQTHVRTSHLNFTNSKRRGIWGVFLPSFMFITSSNRGLNGYSLLLNCFDSADI